MNQINKIEIVNDGSNDEYSKTFTLNDEDHTLSNALRYLIMKNPNVLFCGYTIPHPSEIKVNFKITKRIF
jgi:DNA-directed RNA polymerase I and III subunit RPAC2